VKLSSTELPINAGLILMYWSTSGILFPFLLTRIIHGAIGAFLALYLLGHSLRIAFVGGTTFDHVSLRGRLAFDIALSIICFAIISGVLAVLYLIDEFSLSSLLTLLIIGPILVGIATKRQPPRPAFRIVLSGAPGIGVALFGLLVAFVFREGFVWPSMPGWDVYVHLGVSNWIFAHNGSNTVFAAGNSFLGYPYLFHILVASISYVLGCSPYDVLWGGSFFSIPSYGLLVYALAAFLTQSRTQSVFAGTLAMSISGGDSLLGPQYFFPSTAFVLLFLLCLVAIAESPLHGLSQTVFSATLLVTCYVVYFYTLFLSLGPIIVVLVKRTPNSFLGHRGKLVIIATFGASIVLTYAGSLLLSLGDLSESLKVTLLMTAYPIALWLLIGAGGLIILIRLFFKRIPGYFDHLILGYVAMVLALYLLPVQFSYRAELMLRPFAAILAAYSVVALTWIATYTRASGVDLARVLRTARFPAKVSVFLLLAISVALVVQPYFTYGREIPSYSNLSSDEYQAAAWLVQHTPRGGYVLTDPSTGFVIRGLALLNSSTAFIIRGHTPSPANYPILAELIYHIFYTQNATEIPTDIARLPQRPNFFVITTRTVSWVAVGGVNSTYYAPTSDNIESFAGLPKFSSSMFSLAASWQTVRIYQLT
jgi:hypothetical protein